MRRRIGVCLLVVAAVAPGAASAQTTTVDGARALVGGDYETAVRILRPLAENTSEADPLAQFFLATLYASGHGGGDRIGACALYRAAANSTNPLANQSLALAGAIEREFAPMAQLCAQRMAPGYTSLQPTSFTLGPDHWITIDAAGATVGYGGTEKRTFMTNGGVGVVYLPLRHTALDVSSPVDARRHFIQMFVWSRDAAIDPATWTWTLHWVLFEVVGTDVRPVAGTGRGSVVSVTAAQPPAAFDVDTMVRVRVGANGEAEWIILTDPPRRGAIPAWTPQ